MFVVILVHNTILNLVMYGADGLVIFWEKSLQPITITVHILTALFIAGIYALSIKCRLEYPNHQWHVSEKTWSFCSLFLLLTIVFILF